MTATATVETFGAQTDVAGRLMFARAALGIAGHEVTDPVLVALLERKASGEISMDEFINEARRHVQG